MNSRALKAVLGAVLVAGAAWLIAQGTGSPPAPKANSPKTGVMKLNAGLGSFWLEGQGKVEMTFRGTLLISDFQGTTLRVTGNVRKEWDKYGRQIWFAARDEAGNLAKLVVDGKWRRLQWFGGDLTCTWSGTGMAMLFGEYDDRTDSTGSIQVDNYPKRPWFTTGTTHYLPPRPGEYEQSPGVPEAPAN